MTQIRSREDYQRGATFPRFPFVGQEWVLTTNDVVYRWNGSAWQDISSEAVIGTRDDEKIELLGDIHTGIRAVREHLVRMTDDDITDEDLT